LMGNRGITQKFNRKSYCTIPDLRRAPSPKMAVDSKS
jgi:hypothetical protein